jgi:hypothetical protein
MEIEFKCSDSWLQMFEQQHNVVSLTINGECFSVSIEAAANWHKIVVPVLEHCSL